MKLALFSNSYLPYLSGITISVQTLKDELRQLGHEVFVVGPSYPGHQEKDPQILRLPSLPATYPGYRFVFPYSFRIFRRLKREKIELIHAHQPFGVGLAALLLARRMKVPFVYSFHTLFSRYVHNAPFVPRRLAKWAVANYLTWFCNRADTVIVPSEMVRRLLVRRGVKTPLQVIPTGLKLGAIHELKYPASQRRAVLQKYGLPESSLLLLYSGRISPEKNLPFLLQAFEQARRQEPRAHLILVGGGPQLEKLRRQAGPQVLFAGQLPHREVLEHYFAADLFVYASVTETQGLVLTEAKACGLPIVALFGGGLADVVESGLDGYLTPRQPAVFIEHILRLLRDPELRRRMGEKGAADARDRFSSATVAKRMESVYNSLIDRRGGNVKCQMSNVK